MNAPQHRCKPKLDEGLRRLCDWDDFKCDYFQLRTAASFGEVSVMHSIHTLVAQRLAVVHFMHFEYCFNEYQSNHWTRELTAWGTFIFLAYETFTRGKGLRDLIAYLNLHSCKRCHAGLRQRMSRSTWPMPTNAVISRCLRRWTNA